MRQSHKFENKCRKLEQTLREKIGDNDYCEWAECAEARVDAIMEEKGIASNYTSEQFYEELYRQLKQDYDKYKKQTKGRIPCLR